MLVLNKENILLLLKEFSKRLRKVFRNMDIDIYVVGGSSLTLLCDFRESIMDIDIAKNKSLDFRDVVLSMEDEFDLGHEWLNNNYMYSKSYSPRIVKYIEKTITFSNYIHYHLINPACIAAMKCVALRLSTNDLADIINVTLHVTNISTISEVYEDLYGNAIDTDLLSQLTAISDYMKKNNITDVKSELDRLLKLYDCNLLDMIDDLM